MREIKIIFISILTWSLIYIPSIFAETPMNRMQLEKIATVFTREAGTLADVLTYLDKHKSERSSEIINFIKKEKISNDEKMPIVTVNDNMLEVSVGNEKIFLTLLDNGNAKISYKDKNVLVTKKMTINEIKDELEKVMTKTESFSFIDFFVSKAEALPVGKVAGFAFVSGMDLLHIAVLLSLAVGVAILVGGIGYTIWKFNDWTLESAIRRLDDGCSWSKTSPYNEQEFKKVLNELKSVQEKCKKKADLEICKEILPRVLKCFDDLSSQDKSVNNVGKTSPKPQIEPLQFNTGTARDLKGAAAK